MRSSVVRNFAVILSALSFCRLNELEFPYSVSGSDFGFLSYSDRRSNLHSDRIINELSNKPTNGTERSD
jgi:hypothetical protein